MSRFEILGSVRFGKKSQEFGSVLGTVRRFVTKLFRFGVRSVIRDTPTGVQGHTEHTNALCTGEYTYDGCLLSCAILEEYRGVTVRDFRFGSVRQKVARVRFGSRFGSAVRHGLTEPNYFGLVRFGS